MTTQMHERSMYVDAPVEKVFDYMTDPNHFMDAFPEKDRAHMAIAEMHLTPEGTGSSYRMIGRMALLFHMEWSITRTEYVPNERIVDASSLGGTWTFTFEPEGAGTNLSIAFGWSDKWPKLAAELADRVGWNGDSDLDMILTNIRKAIEG